MSVVVQIINEKRGIKYNTFMIFFAEWQHRLRANNNLFSQKTI